MSVIVGRSRIATKYGIVAASQPLAAQAGVHILERLSSDVDLELWGQVDAKLPRSSPIRSRYRGQAWGMDMYRVLARTPSRIVLAMPADAVGDRRQPNLPGTRDEYPNWRLPLADGSGAEVSLEDFLAAPGTTALSTLLRGSTGPPGARA